MPSGDDEWSGIGLFNFCNSSDVVGDGKEQMKVLVNFWGMTLAALILGLTTGCETTDYELVRLKERNKNLESQVEALEKRIAELEVAKSVISSTPKNSIGKTNSALDNSSTSSTSVPPTVDRAALLLADAAAREALTPFDASFEVDASSGLVKSIDLSNSRNGIDALPLLEKFSGLQALIVKGADLKDESFDLIGKLVTLERLEMDLAPASTQNLEKLLPLKNLKFLQLFRSDISDEGMGVVARLPKLEQLRIGQTRVGDEGVAKLSGVKTLRAIDLSDCNRVSDRSMEVLATLPEIIFLKVWGPQITDAGMKSVGKMKKLRVLGLNDTAVTDVGMNELNNLKDLREIHLFRTSVGDNGIRALVGLSNLTFLNLRDTKISDAAISAIAEQLPGITQLDVSETNSPGVTEQSANAIARLTKLKDVNFWSTAVGDEVTAALAGLPELTRINLDKTKITDRAIEVLATKTDLAWLHVGSTAIGDESAKRLESFPNLKYLNVSYTQMSEDAFFDLFDALTPRKCVVVGP